jgi:hypothetical protein
MTDVIAVQEAAPDVSAAVADAAPEKTPTDIMHEVASEMGWSPKEKWKGNPDDWRDADEFLKRTPQMLKALKKQVESSNRIAADRMEKVRQKAIEDAEARIAAAVESGDMDDARQAMADRDKAAARPDPQAEAFAVKNSWFNTNQAATQLAIAKAGEIANTGGSVAAQLEAAEAEVRKRFPELFDDEPEERPSKAPPAVHGGAQRSPVQAAREKGWNDLPKHIQGAMSEKTLKSFGLSKEEYAKSWFKENA